MTEDEIKKEMAQQRVQLEELIMEVNEKDRRWLIMQDRSIRYRGQIIDKVTILERHLDVYIATYFCDSWNKVGEFANIILGASRISLDGKRKLFDILIKLQDSDFFTRHRSFKVDMNTVMKERNSFAHNLLGMDDETSENYETLISLHKFSVNSRLDYYTEERINSIILTVEKCTKVIEKAAQPRIKILREPDKE